MTLRSAARRLRLLLPVAALALTACRTVHFYTQAAAGQWEIMRKARPIEEVIHGCSGASIAVKGRLALVQELRAFAARELGLPAEKQYDRYTDLGRRYVVWVVAAAPEFSVEAMTWRYPVIGHLKYRGYFSEPDALREGDRLRALGYDVDVSGTGAYSTLGWLRDPVLNTFIHRSDAELAEVIFHELTHQRLYLKGDTDFNEALATAAGEAGAKQWLRSRGRLADLEKYERKLRLQRSLVSAALRTRTELAEIYTHHADEGPERLRALKAAAFARLSAKARSLRSFSWVSTPSPPARKANNATLNMLAAYYTMLPGFERLLAESGHSIPAFLARVEQMQQLPKEERRALVLSQ